jgi:hypothetical protein
MGTLFTGAIGKMCLCVCIAVICLVLSILWAFEGETLVWPPWLVAFGGWATAALNLDGKP